MKRITVIVLLVFAALSIFAGIPGVTLNNVGFNGDIYDIGDAGLFNIACLVWNYFRSFESDGIHKTQH